jgi:hypothetical protein
MFPVVLWLAACAPSQPGDRPSPPPVEEVATPLKYRTSDQAEVFALRSPAGDRVLGVDNDRWFVRDLGVDGSHDARALTVTPVGRVVATHDLDGDGHAEVITQLRGALRVADTVRRDVRLVRLVTSGPVQDFARVDVGDVTGDGIDEFVLRRGTTVETYTLDGVLLGQFSASDHRLAQLDGTPALEVVTADGAIRQGPHGTVVGSLSSGPVVLHDVHDVDGDGRDEVLLGVGADAWVIGATGVVEVLPSVRAGAELFLGDYLAQPGVQVLSVSSSVIEVETRFGTQLTWPRASPEHDVVPVDVDGDGTDEVWQEEIGLAVPSVPEILPLDPRWVDRGGRALVGELDGDGLDEILWQDFDRVEDPATATTLPYTRPLGAGILELRDLEGDGREEILVLDRNELFRYAWDAQNGLHDPRLLSDQVPWAVGQDFRVGDFDGNGNPDLHYLEDISGPCETNVFRGHVFDLVTGQDVLHPWDFEYSFHSDFPGAPRTRLFSRFGDVTRTLGAQGQLIDIDGFARLVETPRGTRLLSATETSLDLYDPATGWSRVRSAPRPPGTEDFQYAAQGYGFFKAGRDLVAHRYDGSHTVRFPGAIVQRGFIPLPAVLLVRDKVYVHDRHHVSIWQMPPVPSP